MNWIKTSERLPEPGENVLVLDKGLEMNVAYLSAPTNFGSVWKDSIKYRVYKPEITHWMPLPEPPKE